MKIARFILAFLLIQLSLIGVVNAQNTDKNYRYLEKDYLKEEKYHSNFIHKLALPGVWGLGFNPTFKIDHLLFASAEAGYGWVISAHEKDFDKKFRGWYSISIGYPILNIITSKKGKWVIDRSYEGDMMYDKYYKINVPTHNSIILLAGYSSEPSTAKIYPDGSGPVVSYSFQAPVYEIGIKLLRQSKTKVRVKEYSGQTQRRFEMYMGIVIPAKNEITTPDGYKNLPKFTKPGYELSFSIPYRLNGWATFDIGVKSLGYTGKDDIAQFFVGNTFYIK